MRDDDPQNDRNWRRFEAMARRGMRKFGNMNMNFSAGDWGDFAAMRPGRMLASGDLRVLVLHLIAQQPRHGYDLIKAIEEMSEGFYSPSPGVIYPALTYLEEAGFTTSSPDGNKKLYTITEEGKAHLADNRAVIEATVNTLSKVGSKARHMQERMASPDFPFTPEQAEKLREMRRPGWPFHHRGRHGHHGRDDDAGMAEDFASGADADDTPVDLDKLRRAIKKAVRRAEEMGPREQQRVAYILSEAIKAIRAGARDPDPDMRDTGDQDGDQD